MLLVGEVWSFQQAHFVVTDMLLAVSLSVSYSRLASFKQNNVMIPALCIILTHKKKMADLHTANYFLLFIFFYLNICIYYTLAQILPDYHLSWHFVVNHVPWLWNHQHCCVFLNSICYLKTKQNQPNILLRKASVCNIHSNVNIFYNLLSFCHLFSCHKAVNRNWSTSDPVRDSWHV